MHAGDRGVQLDVLPGPARGEESLVEGQLVGVGEVLDDTVVAQPEALVVVVDEHERDAVAVPDPPTVRGAQITTRLQGIGYRHLDLRLDPHRREPVHRR